MPSTNSLESAERPGHNGGGNLKSGNTKNVGRLRSVVREKYLDGAEKGGEWMAKVAAGEKCIRVESGRRGGATLRFPTFDEQTRAIEICGKYGLGTKIEMSGEDGGPIPFSTSPDLSALTLEEKETMLALAEKVEAARNDE